METTKKPWHKPTIRTIEDHFDSLDTNEKRIASLQRQIKTYTELLASDQTNEEYVSSIKELTQELERVQAKHSRLLNKDLTDRDKQFLYSMYNATATEDASGEIETYENWLERQLMSRIEKLESLEKNKNKRDKKCDHQWIEAIDEDGNEAMKCTKCRCYTERV